MSHGDNHFDTAASYGDSERLLGPWLERNRGEVFPLEDPRAIGLAVHWILGREDFFLNTVGDVDVLPRVLDEASRFPGRPSAAEMQRLAAGEETSPLFV